MNDTESRDQKKIFSVLENYYADKAVISKEALRNLAKESKIKTISKNGYLQTQGQVPINFYCLIEGVVREHVQGADGNNINIIFREAVDVMGSGYNIRQKTPARYSISAVTDIVVSYMDGESYYNLLERHPDMLESMFAAYEAHYIEMFRRIANLLARDMESHLDGEAELSPDLISRIPSYHLASYYGVTPESFSRIRARLNKRNKK